MVEAVLLLLSSLSLTLSRLPLTALASTADGMVAALRAAAADSEGGDWNMRS